MLNNYSKFKYMICYYFIKKKKKFLSKFFFTLGAARALHMQPLLVLNINYNLSCK